MAPIGIKSSVLTVLLINVRSHHFHDEKAQAAAWMSYAYNEDANGMYLNDAKTSIALMPRNGIWAASWDDKTAITNVRLPHHTQQSDRLGEGAACPDQRCCPSSG